MDFVEPIRDRKKITQIKNLLRGEQRYRDLLLITFGVNTALRISDLLKLTVGQVVNEPGEIVTSLTVREQKTGKRHEVFINDSIRSVLQEFFGYYPGILVNPNHALFFRLIPNLDYGHPISRFQAWRIISQICADVGLRGNYGTHSLRKTWGYHARLSGVDLTLIMDKLNHSSLAVTKRYLGIRDDELEEVVRGLNL